jgi:hypothetical protein
VYDNFYYEKIRLVYDIAEKYKTTVTMNLDKNFNIYVRINDVTVIDKSTHLFVEDIGRGGTIGEACSELLKLYLNQNYLIRYKNFYATRKIRGMIRESKCFTE